MRPPGKFSAAFALVAVVAFASWVTVQPGTPQIYAPLNVLVMIPAFLFAPVMSGAHYTAATAVMPIVFCLWSWRVLRGSATVPRRSLTLLVATVALSAAWLSFGRTYGVQYRGAGYVTTVTVVNALCWVALGVLAFRAKRTPGYPRNLAFHAALFTWLAWYAFPWLGEVP